MAQQGQRVGQRLGNYQVEHLLGRGGFAEVYLGFHVHLRRHVAIKVLHTILSQQEVDAFKREAQIIAALSHPNIVQVFDFDVQQGVPFLVMDYLPYGTLRQRHPKGERVPLPTVINYVQQVADALYYVHQQGLIHRDIKPENLLIGRRNEIVLSDFGIASISHSTSSMMQSSVVGTIYYMAPEQLQSHACPASDQYALGIVTYEWLSGECPFDGSYTEIFGKHLMTPLPSLMQKVPGLPPEVEQVVWTALAKEPGARFKSAQAFANALTAAGEASQKASQPVKNEPEKRVIALPSHLLATRAPIVTVQITPTPTRLPTPATKATAPMMATARPAPVAPAKRMSRRTIVIGLATLGTGAIGGGIAWVALAPPQPTYTRYPTSTPQPTYTRYPTSTLYVYTGHTNVVDSVGWSPDGKQIASGSADYTVQVWNAADGSNAFAYTGHTDRVLSVGWSPDGTRIASGSQDKTVQVWNAADGGNAFTYTGHTDLVYSVGWSPDGTRITSGSFDGTVQVWNAADGGNVFSYTGHAGQVLSVGWSPDGKRIASGSDYKTVQVWNAADGGNVFSYTGHTLGAVWSVGWSPDGKRIASGGVDHTVQVWSPE